MAFRAWVRRMRRMRQAPLPPADGSLNPGAVPQCSRGRRIAAPAWATYRLVRMWISMRFDYSLHVRPADGTLPAGVLTLLISPSKTNRPGKKVEFTTGYVAEDLYLAYGSWLRVGSSFGRGSEMEFAGITSCPCPSATSLGFGPSLLGTITCSAEPASSAIPPPADPQRAGDMGAR